MPPREHEDMTRENFIQDVIVLNFGEVRKTKEYTNSLLSSQGIDPNDKENTKQFIVDNIMNEIDNLHEKAEVYRKDYLK